MCCKTKITSIKCDEIYDTYFSQRVDGKHSEALNSISKAIKCDSVNQDYRFENVKYLISLNKYIEARKELKNLALLNPNYLTHFPLSGLIEFKIGQKKTGEQKLKKVYNVLEKINFNQENFNLFYNSVLLEAYVNGKESALVKLKKNSHIYSDQNERENLRGLISLLNSNQSSISILNEVYGINVN